MLKKHILVFSSTFAFIALWGVAAFAQDPAMAGAAADNGFTAYSWIAIAAGIGVGIAAIGGALGQGRAAVAALEGIARNPGASGQIQTPFIIALALIESLVIYAFVIAILLVLNIDIPGLINGFPN
mgnify:CR=1 FL=1